MKRADILLSVLNIEPGEGSLVLLFWLHYFFIGVGFIFTQTVAFTLFLAEFDALCLPRVYMVMAVILVLTSLVYLKLGERVSFPTLLTVNLSFLLISIGAMRLGLALTTAKWLIFGLPILFQVLLSFANLAFWTLAGRVFNVRQGKRLFGLIGAGQWIAIVIGGFAIPALVALTELANLLILAGLGMAGTFVMMRVITHKFAERLTAKTVSTPSSEPTTTADRFVNRYARKIFSLTLLGVVGFFVIDNIFYDRAQARYPDEAQLAGFIGMFFAMQGALTALSSAFISGPILSRYGLGLSLLILPATLAIGTLSMIVCGSVIDGTTLFFWLAALNKLLNLTCGLSIDLSARTLLYQPLPAKQRGQVQTITDGIVHSIAIGFAAAILLLSNQLLAFGPVQLAYVLLAILVAWNVVAVLLGREYPAMLVGALTKAGAITSLSDKWLDLDGTAGIPVLHVLNRCGFRATTRTQVQILAKMSQAKETLAVIVDTEKDSSTVLLCEAVTETLNQLRTRVFYLHKLRHFFKEIS